ncbi:uncharacterized protein G2W53_010078 [Senna tora]|uniref:Uncharacterized protein n=1 Tax=Senna tora TaxID=362788 RepID=A0A834WZI6_9FABA|nr:uncharacterized protein G2W53_010078 [Senna tora]
MSKTNYNFQEGLIFAGIGLRSCDIDEQAYHIGCDCEEQVQLQIFQQTSHALSMTPVLPPRYRDQSGVRILEGRSRHYWSVFWGRRRAVHGGSHGAKHDGIAAGHGTASEWEIDWFRL